MIEKKVEFLKELSMEKLLLIDLKDAQKELCEVKVENQILETRLNEILKFFDDETPSTYHGQARKGLLETVKDGKTKKENEILDLEIKLNEGKKQNHKLFSELTKKTKENDKLKENKQNNMGYGMTQGENE